MEGNETKIKKKGNDGKGQKMEGNRRSWKTNERT